jgi:hypothetical protein
MEIASLSEVEALASRLRDEKLGRQISELASKAEPDPVPRMPELTATGSR